MIKFNMIDTRYNYDALGYLPFMLRPDDERSAAEQLNDNYSHGGGWRPFEGFEMKEDHSIQYPGDPAYKPIAEAQLRNEKIIFYPHAWVAIVQEDGSFEICRMD